MLIQIQIDTMLAFSVVAIFKIIIKTVETCQGKIKLTHTHTFAGGGWELQKPQNNVCLLACPFQYFSENSWGCS